MRRIFLMFCLVASFFSCENETEDLATSFDGVIEPNKIHDESVDENPESIISSNHLIINTIEKPAHFKILGYLRNGSVDYTIKSTNVDNAILIDDFGNILVKDPLAFDVSKNSTINLVLNAKAGDDERDINVTIHVAQGEAINISEYEYDSSFRSEYSTTSGKFILECSLGNIEISSYPTEIDSSKKYIISPVQTEEEEFAEVSGVSNGYVTLTKKDDELYLVELNDVYIKTNTLNNYQYLDTYSFMVTSPYANSMLTLNNLNNDYFNASSAPIFFDADEGKTQAIYWGYTHLLYTQLFLPKNFESGTYEINNIESNAINDKQAVIKFVSAKGRYVGVSGYVNIEVISGIHNITFNNIVIEQTTYPNTQGNTSGSLTY